MLVVVGEALEPPRVLMGHSPEAESYHQKGWLCHCHNQWLPSQVPTPGITP